ncbi:Gustatory receptor 43j [Halyomorpha halys]|nr:Gustatory receptor 43j [Halyomorpha halys]
MLCFGLLVTVMGFSELMKIYNGDTSIRSKMCRSFASSLLLNPIFIASTILGVFPFRSVKHLSIFDKLLFCYSVVVVTIFSYIGYNSIPNTHNMTSIPAVLIAVILFVSIFQSPCCLISVSLQRNLLRKTVSSIQHLLSEYDKIKLNNWNSYNAKCFALFNVIHPVLALFIFWLTGNLPVFSIGLVLFFTYVFLGSSVCLSQFCFLLSILCELLETEITVLKTIKRTVYRKRNIKMIEKFIDSTNQIISVARDIDCIYSYQNLYLISTKFFNCLVSMFFIIEYASVRFNADFRLILGDFLLILYHFYNSWKIFHASEITIQKSKEFNTLLYQLMIDDTTNEILHNDKLRLHISMKREVVFTACGFFNLDYTLVHSMIASATTYLVILIQFGQSGSAAPESLPTVITNLTTTPLPLSLTTYQ